MNLQSIVCLFLKHDFQPYVSKPAMSLFYGMDRQPTKQCERCGTLRYTAFKETKVATGQVIKFRRYEPIKSKKIIKVKK